jgi:hypothetical protein
MLRHKNPSHYDDLDLRGDHVRELREALIKTLLPKLFTKKAT